MKTEENCIVSLKSELNILSIYTYKKKNKPKINTHTEIDEKEKKSCKIKHCTKFSCIQLRIVLSENPTGEFRT